MLAPSSIVGLACQDLSDELSHNNFRFYARQYFPSIDSRQELSARSILNVLLLPRVLLPRMLFGAMSCFDSGTLLVLRFGVGMAWLVVTKEGTTMP
jgi:hypothetical protein